ncbi:MAG: class I SAM-dependent methyltransferase [Candidatus Marinimicrobia bacterium]|nr:class I SAM-dependent methyltransferase [Candidatus Neomarinimicrobiota bacterium]MBL7030377.1 class I SAM-dependent methyltransferase [Candidatus Neomarinimicrobiota bacterium]
MAVKWYLKKDDASWHSFWNDISIDDEITEAKNDYPLMLNAIIGNTNANSVVLEGGCGLGKFLFFLREKKYTNLIGVDFNEKPLDIIKKRDPIIDVRVGDVNKLPLEDNSVDLYLSMGVIEHFEDGPQNALNEAYRVVKINGTLIVAVPYQNVYRGTFRKWVTMPILKLLNPSFRNSHRVFYQYYYSKKDLKKFILNSGFEILDWFYYDQYHTKNQRIGICLEFPFTKNKNNPPYGLNIIGKILSFLSELISKAIFSSSIAYVVKKPNS